MERPCLKEQRGNGRTFWGNFAQLFQEVFVGANWGAPKNNVPIWKGQWADLLLSPLVGLYVFSSQSALSSLWNLWFLRAPSWTAKEPIYFRSSSPSVSSTTWIRLLSTASTVLWKLYYPQVPCILISELSFGSRQSAAQWLKMIPLIYSKSVRRVIDARSTSKASLWERWRMRLDKSFTPYFSSKTGQQKLDGLEHFQW